ncbi:hypothetical protein [Marivirga sp.]|uniref:hypothetical protein n=1 Tax=Marivirga sp. TaxID=2018662 RepID=UPI002D7EA268|nr:hypothetical protein [Marivirga sp.]HET8859783.1 hypothetical protein [Marivirga sp.]
MSSHHIIRDEQEPPILVFSIHNNWKELSELLGWSPIVFINPPLQEIFDALQTKIDGYLLNEDYEAKLAENVFIYNEHNLDEVLLKWINHKKWTAINIFCNDQLMKNLFFQLKRTRLEIPLIFFTENGKSILKPSSKFRKWYPKKCKLEIFNDDVLKTENLVLSGKEFTVERDGFILIEVQGDTILVKEK